MELKEMKKLGIFLIGIGIGIILGSIMFYEYKLEQPIKKSTTQQKIDSVQSEIQDLRYLKTQRIYEQMLREEELENN